MSETDYFSRSFSGNGEIMKTRQMWDSFEQLSARVSVLCGEVARGNWGAGEEIASVFDTLVCRENRCLELGALLFTAENARVGGEGFYFLADLFAELSEKCDGLLLECERLAR
jgi:hypothetical protein